jgi:zinc protease
VSNIMSNSVNNDGPLLLLERDDALPLVHGGVCTRSGAAEDPEELLGLTRLCGRLMRRTAGGLPADEVDARIDRMGAALGLDSGHGSTALSGSVLERSYDDFMRLFEQILLGPGFAEDELERLKRETLAELTEILDSDQQLAQRWFLRSLFAGHAYGRTVIGSQNTLRAIGVADVRRCYERHFTRQNLVFSFAGAVDRERVERASRALWDALPPGQAPAAPPAEPVAPKGRRLVFVDKPERTQTQILIGGLGTHPSDPDHFPLLVANTVFGGTFTARLTQEVRAKRGWSYGAYSSLGYDRRRQAFSMWTFPKAEDAAPCMALELEMLKDWWQRGLSADELGWAKRYLAQSQAFSCDTAAKRLGLELDELTSDLPKGHYARFVASVGDVTLEQANRAIQSRISLDDLTIVVVGTHAAIGDAVRRVIPDLREDRVVPFDTE